MSKNRSFNDSNIIFEKIDKNVTNFYKKINNLKEISSGNKMNRSLFNIKRHTYKKFVNDKCKLTGLYHFDTKKFDIIYVAPGFIFENSLINAYRFFSLSNL